MHDAVAIRLSESERAAREALCRRPVEALVWKRVRAVLLRAAASSPAGHLS